MLGAMRWERPAALCACGVCALCFDVFSCLVGGRRIVWHVARNALSPLPCVVCAPARCRGRFKGGVVPCAAVCLLAWWAEGSPHAPSSAYLARGERRPLPLSVCCLRLEPLLVCFSGRGASNMYRRRGRAGWEAMHPSLGCGACALRVCLLGWREKSTLPACPWRFRFVLARLVPKRAHKAVFVTRVSVFLQV